MNPNIKNAIIKGDLILFLGAGAACSSLNKYGESLPLANALAKDMSENERFNEPYDDEPLSIVYSSLKSKYHNQVDDYLEDKLRFCTPSPAYQHIASFAWKRIYTINIDDAMDKALLKHSKQDINICGMRSAYKNSDATFSRLEFIKLHGSVDRLEDGVIFSPDEYAYLSSSPHHWYSMLPQEYMDSVFLFIGTKLNEPAFEKVLADYRIKFNDVGRRQYLLVPSMKEHEINSLQSRYNIEYISGTIEDFSAWLAQEFPSPITPQQLYYANNLYLTDGIQNSLNTNTISNILTDEKLRILNSVTPLGRPFFNSVKNISQDSGEKAFYTGMKPTWEDIKSEIPAELKILVEFRNFVLKNIEIAEPSLTLLVGPAGSGKTTTLMQTAYAISKACDIPVFWYRGVEDLDIVIQEIDNLYNKYVLFIDKISDHIKSIKKLINKKGLSKCKLIGTERKNIWIKKCEATLVSIAQVKEVNRFAEEDVLNILIKLQKYGRWTRLATMNEEQRVYEFINRADKQLLIALLEATRGKGFKEIIEDDYNELELPEEKLLVNMVGLYTLHDKKMRKSHALRTLRDAYPGCKPETVLHTLEGILHEDHNFIYVRHPVYVEHLYRYATTKKELASAIQSIIESFSAYEVPYALSLPKNDYVVFKAILNYKFMRYKINNIEEINNVFKNISKQLEGDGHFWLQYGLVLYSYKRYEDALDKLETSVHIYDQPYAKHALGRILLKLALVSQDAIKAERYFQEGRALLELLDNDPRFRDDFYPIVSLADGVTRYIARSGNKEKAQELAKSYANDIYNRLRGQQGNNKYLRNAWSYMTTYSITGRWPHKKGFLEQDSREF